MEQRYSAARLQEIGGAKMLVDVENTRRDSSLSFFLFSLDWTFYSHLAVL